MNDDPAPAAATAKKPRTNLQERVISGLVLGAIVFALTWFGGAAFRLLAVVIGLAVYYEWEAMAGMSRSREFRLFSWALVALCGVVILAGLPAQWMFAAIALAILACGVGGVMSGQGIFLAGGLAYALVPAACLALLRGQGPAGAVAVVFLFATVWATDIFAYFAGRRFGGPKLAPGISPNKTWSGALGGALAAILAGAVVVWIAGTVSGFAAMLALALFISVVAQAGDLFESAVKRRFGVKDSGQMIPGHGGMMDRVDGLLAGAVALYLLGALLAGIDTPAHGLFVG